MHKRKSDITIFIRQVKQHAEAICWSSAILIISLASMDGPSLCFFKLAGIPFCPGCGLAHAMQEAIYLNFRDSLSHHPMGLPAVLILLYRIYILTFKKIKPDAKQEFYDAGPGNRA